MSPNPDPDETGPADHNPVNPLPPVVVALFLLIAGIEGMFSLGERGIIGGPTAVGWRLDAIQTYSFSGDIFDWMLANGRFPPEQLMRFVTYPFVHVSFTHTLFVIVFLLALGKMVGEIFGGFATLAVFVFSAVIGALAYGLLLNDPIPLVGGYPAVYGLIGAFTFLLWTRLGELGENQYRAFLLIGFLMGIQLIFGLLFGGSRDWVADVSGFAAGFVLSFVLAPGGWAAMLNRLRRR